MVYCQSFPPEIDHTCKVLVLGSMPGVVSLQNQQYYAQPHNQFWPIIFAVIGVHLPLNYDQRLRLIRSVGIALWDVIASCDRQGSLDKDITQIIPNDLSALLNHYPSIKLVAFNGTKAKQVFRCHVHLDSHPGLDFLTLPSTSPAHTKPFNEKLKDWSVIRNYLSG
jgi:TDG/mug DNA glycosylase family protein